MRPAFLDGLARALGLMIPGAAIGTAAIYWRIGLTQAEHLMVISIVALFIFTIIGYSIFHRSLYDSFGRLALFCFVSWTASVAVVRLVNLFELATTDQQRIINTVSALVFTTLLTYKTWWKAWLRSALSYFLNGKATVDPNARRRE